MPTSAVCLAAEKFDITKMTATISVLSPVYTSNNKLTDYHSTETGTDYFALVTKKTAPCCLIIIYYSIAGIAYKLEYFSVNKFLVQGHARAVDFLRSAHLRSQFSHISDY